MHMTAKFFFLLHAFLPTMSYRIIESLERKKNPIYFIRISKYLCEKSFNLKKTECEVFSVQFQMNPIKISQHCTLRSNVLTEWIFIAFHSRFFLYSVVFDFSARMGCVVTQCRFDRFI